MARKPNPLLATGALALAIVAGVGIARYTNSAQAAVDAQTPGEDARLIPASLNPDALTNAVSGALPDLIATSDEPAAAASDSRAASTVPARPTAMPRPSSRKSGTASGARRGVMAADARLHDHHIGRPEYVVELQSLAGSRRSRRAS